jgi:hypothetical protein
MMFVPLLLLVAANDGRPAKVTLTGTAKEVRLEAGRWGGAAPAPEEVERQRTHNQAQENNPQPLAGVAFVVIPGSKNSPAPPVAKFVPDGEGRFKVTLPPGNYCIVKESRRPSADAGVVPMFSEPSCLADLQAACDASWVVKGAADVSFTLTRTEGGPPPCYHGPSPPRAAPPH